MNKPLRPTSARNAYNNGYILVNHQNGLTLVFQLLGFNFTTNPKRAHNGRNYKLDDPQWALYANNNLVTKLHLILTQQVHLIRSH